LPGFIPLDNTKNLRPDWFEFWVILNFLRNNTLENDTWYGFLSPKFQQKTGFNSAFVLDVIERYGDLANVALFSQGWDHIAYFINSSEQGEVFHPGLMRLSQDFIDKVGLEVNLKTLVSDSTSSGFSNYIIAKREFWTMWKNIAEQFFVLVENDPAYQIEVSYKNNPGPMKTFIQERLSSIILSTQVFKVLTPDYSLKGISRLFPSDTNTRRLLQTCDLMKSKYRKTKDEEYLKMYWKIRSEIQYTELTKPSN